VDARSYDKAIVVGVDGSERSLSAVDWAARTAQTRRAPLVLVHAQGIPSLYVEAWPPPQSVRAAQRERSEAILAEAKAAAGELVNDVDVRTISETGDPSPVLITASRSAAMLVVGSTGHSRLVTGLLGSTA
jgi:nucleotide-binding universal stress UspA family protein